MSRFLFLYISPTRGISVADQARLAVLRSPTMVLCTPREDPGPSRDPLRARTRSASLRTRNPNTDPRQAESTLRFLGLGFCRIRFETRYPATQDYIQYRPGLKYPGHPALTTVRVRADTACTNRSRFMPIGYDRLYHPSQTLRTVLSITAL